MHKINWNIEWMKCLTRTDILNNYVVECGWRATATQDSHVASSYGTCSFSVDTSNNTFTPYSELTEEQVLNWCWNSGINKNATESNLEQQLETLMNPPTVQLSLPWQA